MAINWMQRLNENLGRQGVGGAFGALGMRLMQAGAPTTDISARGRGAGEAFEAFTKGMRQAREDAERRRLAKLQEKFQTAQLGEIEAKTAERERLADIRTQQQKLVGTPATITPPYMDQSQILMDQPGMEIPSIANVPGRHIPGTGMLANVTDPSRIAAMQAMSVGDPGALAKWSLELATTKGSPAVVQDPSSPTGWSHRYPSGVTVPGAPRPASDVPKLGTTVHQNALNMGFPVGSPEYKAFIETSLTTPSIRLDLGDREELERFKIEAALHGKRLEKFQGLATAYDELRPRLETIIYGLEHGGVETGQVAEALMPLRQVMNEMGWRIDENMSAQEQVKASMAFLAPRMRVVGSGSTSDMEMKEFKTAAPRYANTPEGNIIMARSFLQIDARNKRAYDIALRYYSDEGTLAGVDEHIEKILGPVFPKPITQKDYDAVPAGTVYFQGGDFKVKR